MTVLSSPHLPRAARSGVLVMVLAVGLSAFGVGCGDGRQSRPDSESAEPGGMDKEVTVPIPAVTTTVLDPGAEPRSALRSVYPTGTTQRVTLHTSHHIEQQINDQPGSRDYSTPALSIPMTAETNSSGVDLTLGSVTSPDPTLAEALTKVDGSHAGFDLDGLGAITALRIEPQADASNTARSAVEQAFYQAVYRSIAFPDEPVGEGAVWTVQQEVNSGVLLDQVTTATLTKREGDRLTIQLDVRQTPRTPNWQLPNNAGTLGIDDYTMNGQGTITVDLGLPLPVSGSITVGGHQGYRDPNSDSMLQQSIETQVSWTE